MCNKNVDHTLSETVSRVFAKANKDADALAAYRDTINKIDDFFEYANDSEKEREFIQEKLAELTVNLKEIYNV